MIDRMIGPAVGFVVFFFVCFAVGFLLVLVFGRYHYEYRCTSGIAEQRLHIDVAGDHVLGNFEPIDGDPAGACP